MATPWGGELSHEPISANDLLAGTAPEGLTANFLFAPPEGSRPADEPLVGTLRLDGAPMTMLASDRDGQLNPVGFTSNPVIGKDTTLFPDVSVSFFTHNGHLVPTTQHVHKNGILPGAPSWWDLLVQPGRVWVDPRDPRGWNRAAFPFGLTNSADTVVHLGLAMFLYKEDEVSPVRFQVVQQGSPWLVGDFFAAWGVTRADYRRGGIDDLAQRRSTYDQELARKLPTQPWSALHESVSTNSLVESFTTQPRNDVSDQGTQAIVTSAAVHNGVLYRNDCRTAAGPYPYLDEARLTAFSLTKPALLGVARFRIAEKYGTQFLDEPIADYLPAARRPDWADVTFRDMGNMASGHSISTDPDAYAGYLPVYICWFAHRLSRREKTELALDLPRVREPGTAFHYHDQDSYLAGVALDAFLKSKEGPDASVWGMLEREVFEPIGIYHAPSASTVETDETRGEPLWAVGYYPSLDDLAKIGMLMHNHGVWEGRQILHRGLVDELRPTTIEPDWERLGVPPKSTYFLNWSFQQHDSWWVAQHGGFKGNTLALLPNDVVTVRLSNAVESDLPWPPAGAAWPPDGPCQVCNADGPSSLQA